MSPLVAAHVRRARRWAWAMLGFISAVSLLLLVVEWPWRVELAVSDGLTYELPMLVAAVLAGVLAFRLRRTIEVRFWGLLSASLALVVIGEVHWTWYAVVIDPHGPPPSHPAHLLKLAAMALFLALVVTMTTFAGGSGLGRLRLSIDIVGGLLATIPIVYVVWTLPAMGGLPKDGASWALFAAAYPVFGMMIAAGTIAVMAGWKASKWRPWERLVTGSLLLMATGVVAFPVWLPAFLEGDDYGQSWFTAILGCGYAVMAVAAVYRMTASPEESLVEPWPVPRVAPDWTWQAYPVALALALPVLGWITLTSEDPRVSVPVLWFAAGLALALAARSATVAIETATEYRQMLTDPATGILNRTALETEVEHALDMASGTADEVSLVVIALSDVGTMGVMAELAVPGAARAAVAQVLKEDAVTGSVFAASEREVAAILPGTGSLEAAAIARRAWLHARRRPEVAEGIELAAGVATYPAHARTHGALIAAASAAAMRSLVSEDEPVEVYDPRARELEPDERAARLSVRAARGTVRALAEAVDARDPKTTHHSENVSELATALAQVLDLDDERVQVCGLAALMHDVGKVGVRPSVLLKSDLDAEERRELREHPVLGERIVAPTGIDSVLPLVRHHHERWDGAGYPDGLAGEQIPYEARILAVCDAFEVLTAGRGDRASLSVDEALERVESDAGTAFDPVVAATFVRMVRKLGGGMPATVR